MAKSNAAFVEVAHLLIAEAETRLKLGECSPTLLRDYKHRLAAYAEPFFGKTLIKDVTHRKLKEFRNWLANRNLKTGSVNPIMSFVSKVLQLALDEEIIERKPVVPRAQHRDCPRPAFSRSDYRKLLAFMRKVEHGKPEIEAKGRRVNWELRTICTFMTNSFLRPWDLFVLQHKHIEIIEPNDGGPAYLRLNIPPSKCHGDPVITMPVAVKIYRTVKSRNAKAGFGGPEDYVFLPDIKGRRYAQEVVRRQLAKVLKAGGMEANAKGDRHSLYSFRHTAIMFRLLYAKELDLLTLARACRTSVEMIDRFYARSLTAEMNRERLHSFRRPTRYDGLTA